MTATLALPVVLLASGWLVFVGVVCAVSPGKARSGPAAMGSSWAAQLGEHVPRAIVDIGMILRAPMAKFPGPFEVAG